MSDLSKLILRKDIEDKVGESLFVKNIIVNKENVNEKKITYIPTQKWLMQLGKRLIA